MSEPVSNAEVEDVLASIRRLVSDDTRVPREQGAPPADAPAKGATVASTDSRLVLTPSLRVAEEEDAADAAWSEAEDRAENDAREAAEDAPIALDVPESPRQKADPLILSSAVPEGSLAAEGWNGRGPMDAGDKDVLSVSLDHAKPQREADNTSPDVEPGSPLASALEEVAAYEPQGFEFRHHAGRGETDDETAVTADGWSVDGADEAADHLRDDTDEDDADFNMSEPVPSDTLSAKIAALEAVIGRKLDTWEPDGVDADPYSGTKDPALAWEDKADDDAAPDGDVAEAPPEPVAETAMERHKDAQVAEHEALTQATEQRNAAPTLEAQDTALVLEQSEPAPAPEHRETVASAEHVEDAARSFAEPAQTADGSEAMDDFNAVTDADFELDETPEAVTTEAGMAEAPMDAPVMEPVAREGNADDATESQPAPVADEASAASAQDMHAVPSPDAPRIEEEPVATEPRDATGDMRPSEAESEKPAETQAPGDDATKPARQADAEMLDEAALRDMVAEIVRQELQGALGERITRNVRKLVRREIHRALATQELD